MTAVTSPFVDALAWTLVHFLWQGAALGVAVFLWLRLRRPSAQARYAGGIAALAVLLATPVGTFMWLGAAGVHVDGASVDAVPPPTQADPRSDAEAATPTPATPLPGSAMPPPENTGEASDVAAAAIVGAWAAGVLLLSLRLAGGWVLTRRLTLSGTVPAAENVREVTARLAHRLGLRRAVHIVESSAVAVPVLVGWMKPVVLLPAAALSGLSAGQIEALIAHELAHVRRHDYAVNILQSMVETLLFYHPAVWFVSREVREAREHCCDDLAIGVCDRVVYVRALADLAVMVRVPRTALAATDGSLLRRVQRLLGQPGADRGPGAAWLGVLSVALVVGGVMPPTFGSSATEPEEITQAVGNGVAGGVGEGVAGGVSGGAGVGAGEGVSGDGAAQSGQREQERLRHEEELRRLRQRAEQMERQLQQGLTNPDDVRALEARLAEVERQLAASRSARPGRTGIDVAGTGSRSTAQLEARAVLARGEVEAALAELERSRQLRDVGVISPSALRELEARVASGARQLEALAVEISATAEEAALRDTLEARRARIQTEGRVRQAQAEIDAASQSLKAVQSRVGAGLASPNDLAEARARQRDAEQQLQSAAADYEFTRDEAALRQRRTIALRQLVRELEELRARYALGSGDPLARSAVVADAAARVQAGDILTIEIAGEPDLPSDYRVSQEGTIRIPLVGSVGVAKLTADQAREAIAAALKARQLAEGRTISIVLRRPK